MKHYAFSLSERSSNSDLKGARDWFRKSAEKGNVVAMRKFGEMLASGSGGPTDENAARRWLTASAERKDRIAPDYLVMLKRTTNLRKSGGQPMSCFEMAEPLYVNASILPALYPGDTSERLMDELVLFKTGDSMGTLYFICTHKEKNRTPETKTLSRAACACIGETPK